MSHSHETARQQTRQRAIEAAKSSQPGSEEIVVNAELLNAIAQAQPFTSWTGLEVVSAEDGRVETRMRLRPEDMTQHHGFLHGGLVGFLADNAAAYAAATVVGDVLTAQFSLNFLRPGVGDEFAARAEVVKAGKRQVVVEVKVYALSDTDEKLIATANAVILPAGAAALEQR
ncbi:MAG: PaaI family thioesterase [Pseudomonadota bacterium]